MQGLTRHIQDEADLAGLAAALAEAVRPGDVLCLNGPMAVGKTHFAITFAAALDSRDQVSSPTYTLAHIYRTAGLPVIHVDAYRLSGPAEFLDLGLEEDLAEGAALIEWAERLGGLFPDALQITLDFAAAETGRIVTIGATADRWAPVLEALA